MPHSRFALISSLAALALAIACGGGHSGHDAGPASSLAYTDPANPAGFYLKVEPDTNNTARIVLDLMSATPVQAQGLSFYLSVDPTLATWTRLGDAPTHAANGTTFTLEGGQPQAFLTKVKEGDLQVGLYQRNGSVTTQPGAPLVRIGLTLGSTGVKEGTTITLAATPGSSSVYVDASGAVRPFPAPITLGTLTAK
jgi:hypothetical protein